jgi:TonB family protein
MKTTYLPVICLALWFALSAAAQPGANAPEQSALKIIQTEEARFPLLLQNSRVLNGSASIAFDIDEHGRLTDVLVTGYSRQEFAESAVEALRTWKFEPPRLNGQAWASVQELHFDYSRTGVVVSLTSMELIAGMMEDLVQGQLAYRTHTLRELDRIPTPVKVVPPASPALAPNQGKHSLVVEFYIDEQGRVRMPSVARIDAGTHFATSALDAVKQWRFEPPLVSGRPVLVLAKQEFNFVTK